jgi:hypothetical protein
MEDAVFAINNNVKLINYSINVSVDCMCIDNITSLSRLSFLATSFQDKNDIIIN